MINQLLFWLVALLGVVTLFGVVALFGVVTLFWLDSLLLDAGLLFDRALGALLFMPPFYNAAIGFLLAALLVGPLLASSSAYTRLKQCLASRRRARSLVLLSITSNWALISGIAFEFFARSLSRLILSSSMSRNL